jgi:hypothetical protein
MAQDDDVFVVGVKLNRAQLVAMLDEVHGNLDFDIKIKMAKRWLGSVLAALPPKVNPQIDRMVEREADPPRPGPGGPYQPRPGTAPHAIMQILTRGPVNGATALAQQLTSRFHERAVNTSFYQLRDRGWVKKLSDGRYGLGPKAPKPAKPKPKPAAKKKKTLKPSTPKVVAESKANGAGAQA